MKRTLIFLFVMFLITGFTLSNRQSVTCDELMKFIKENGISHGEVSTIDLIHSDWLKKVKAYKYDYKIYVIATIKKDDWGISTQDYVFCNVPETNWSSFSSFYNMSQTYGERFHTYIIDYQCNCE